MLRAAFDLYRQHAIFHTDLYHRRLDPGEVSMNQVPRICFADVQRGDPVAGCCQVLVLAAPRCPAVRYAADLALQLIQQGPGFITHQRHCIAPQILTVEHRAGRPR